MAAAALLKAKPNPTRRRHQRGHDQHLPLRHLQPACAPPSRSWPRAATPKARRSPSSTPTGARHEHHHHCPRTATRRGLSRRRFLGASGASAGLVVAFHIPFARHAPRPRTPTRREINAWVVVKPDDTVIIRIARSEMGQGSADRPGATRGRRARLQLGQSHHRIPDARPEPGAQPRVGQFLAPAAAAAYASRTTTCARAAPPPARCWCRPRPTSWKVPAAECTAANSVITHTPSGRKTTYGKVALAAAKVAPPADRHAQGPERLEARRQAPGAAGHHRQSHRQAGLRHRPQAARHAQRGHQGLPGVRRQAQELRRGRDRKTPRRQESGARSATARSPWWPTPGGAPKARSTPCPSTGTTARTTRRPAQASSADPEGRAGRARGHRRQPATATRKRRAGRRPGASSKRCTPTRYQNHATMEPMNATAQWTPERCEVWTPTQNGEAALAACVGSGRPAQRAVRGLQDPPGRRLRPARPRSD